jgi:hypothetical protein
MPRNEATKMVKGMARQPSTAPHHRQELAVAQAQALSPGQVVVAVGDRPHQQVPRGQADRPRQPGDVVGGEGGQEEDGDRGQGDHVGQALGVEVDERQHHQHAGEGEVEREAGRAHPSASPDRPHELPADERARARR